MKNWQKVMLRGKAEGEMALLSEGSSVKENPEDKQTSVPCVRGSTKISRWVTLACFTGDCIGVISVGLGGRAMGHFLDECRVESLCWAHFGVVLLLCECCLDGVLLLECGHTIWGAKLWEPRCLILGEVRYWRLDLDLRCKLPPLSWGAVPASGDSSLDLLTSSSWEVLWHLWLEHPSSLWQAESTMACTSSRCHSWTCLTALFRARSYSLMRASSLTFSLLLVMIRVAWVRHAISVSVLSSNMLHMPTVSVISLSSNSDLAGHPDPMWPTEGVVAMMMLVARVPPWCTSYSGWWICSRMV